jgi:hypothetical protein
MSPREVVLWLLILIPFVDFAAAVVLVRAARVKPRVQLLYDRARSAVVSTVAAALVAILSLLFIQGRVLIEPWGSLLLFGALILPGLIAPLFLLDYVRGLYDEEA